ncbi:hypothetical protein L226DRAFT_509720 [Lentinus tigrinus ALCF2SS1-7]|uniref:Thioesterase domain-containing protein n=1 Tax=Lentinus tigrinus ALCF2SS1-6 TaxID=1328759 RepID=A0A5C2RYP8_9APHY|nr:hypothetical protein L227DRAFT_289209 [Lentinus tigrinus ALCF2SS1-6]RPD73928.1 hypothetical protein L226DRAFT_509720 [Lentinus tigrinus ALCF2SS1-7]
MSAARSIPVTIDRLRAFPPAPAPNDDPRTVKSNLAQQDVRLCQNVLAYHIAHHPDSRVFGHEQVGGLKLVEITVTPRGALRQTEKETRAPRPDDFEGVTVCELTVQEGMLNVHGTLAGACAVLAIDLATFAPLFALSALTGIDASGFSTSMNIVWHAPAVPGMTLRFVGTTLSFKGRMASARCEVYDKKKGTLVISATHVVAPVQGLPVAGGAAAAKL